MHNPNLLEDALKSLNERRRELLVSIKKHTGHSSFGDTEGDVTEETDEAEDMVNEMGIAQATREELEEVELALTRLKKGTYGKCVKCNNEIDPKSLKNSPAMALCSKCR